MGYRAAGIVYHENFFRLTATTGTMKNIAALLVLFVFTGLVEAP